jgi:hypothetical protein
MRHLDLADLVALAAEASEVDVAKLLDLLDTAEVSAVLADARPPRPPHESAATVLAGIVAVAPLPAGNRRLALLAAVHLLALNGLEVVLDQDATRELFAAGVDAASVAAWLDGRVTAREPLDAAVRNLLSDDAIRAVTLAGERARRHRRRLATPGDLLMGVFQEGTGAGAQALGADAPGMVEASPRPPAFDGEARKVLELALRAATTLGHRSITGGHLLLGLLDAGHVGELPDNLDPADVRRRVLDLLGPGRPGDDDLAERLARVADRLEPVDPDATAELRELADLHRVGLDRLVAMIRAWRGEVFLESLARDALLARLLGAGRLGGTVPDAPDDEVLATYLSAIAEYPRLSRAEEAELALSIRADARRILIQSNLHVVAMVARSYEGHGLSLVELIHHGNVGLMHAAEHYEPTKGSRFSAFATWWVRQAITKAIADRRR